MFMLLHQIKQKQTVLKRTVHSLFLFLCFFNFLFKCIFLFSFMLNWFFESKMLHNFLKWGGGKQNNK